MIAQIIVGSGNNRKAIEMVRDRDTRRDLANKLKGFLFGDNRDYKQAHARGVAALGGAA